VIPKCVREKVCMVVRMISENSSQTRDMSASKRGGKAVVVKADKARRHLQCHCRHHLRGCEDVSNGGKPSTTPTRQSGLGLVPRLPPSPPSNAVPSYAAIGSSLLLICLSQPLSLQRQEGRRNGAVRKGAEGLETMRRRLSALAECGSSRRPTQSWLAIHRRR
jgi:hypothetical protein